MADDPNEFLAAALEEMPDPPPPGVDTDTDDGQGDTLSDAVAATQEGSEPPQPAEPPQKPPAGDKPAGGDASAEPPEPTADDFSDARPWTPERIKNASALLAKQRTEADEVRTRAHDLYQQAVGKAQKFQRRYDNFQAEKQALQVERQQFLTGVQALRQGTPEQRVAAIQLLTGQDGVKWFEEMTLELASGGTARKVDPAVAELRQAMLELQQTLRVSHENQTLQAEAQQHQAAIQSWQSAITQAVAQRADIAPVSADIARKAPQRYARAILAVKEAEYKARGFPIDDRAAVDILETQLKAERDLYHSDGTAGSGPDANGKIAAANPATTPSAPQLTPSLATEPGGGLRPLDEAESIQAVVNEMPDDFWAQLQM